MKGFLFVRGEKQLKVAWLITLLSAKGGRWALAASARLVQLVFFFPCWESQGSFLLGARSFLCLFPLPVPLFLPLNSQTPQPGLDLLTVPPLLLDPYKPSS